MHQVLTADIGIGGHQSLALLFVQLHEIQITSLTIKGCVFLQPGQWHWYKHLNSSTASTETVSAQEELDQMSWFSCIIKLGYYTWEGGLEETTGMTLISVSKVTRSQLTAGRHHSAPLSTFLYWSWPRRIRRREKLASVQNWRFRF